MPISPVPPKDKLCNPFDSLFSAFKVANKLLNPFDLKSPYSFKIHLAHFTAFKVAIKAENELYQMVADVW